MTVSAEQIASIHAEFGDSASAWSDSMCLSSLLVVAHAYDVLAEVDIYPILDEEDEDIFLVSVELCPGVYAHAAPMYWRDTRPKSGVSGVDALRHVLGRLREVARQVHARFLHEVAEIVAEAMMPPPQ